MKSPPALCAILICMSLSFTAGAQDIGTIYGLDPLLHNGRIYAFTLSSETIGHPFLHSQDYKPGYVIIMDQKFEDVLLNYDIYNQELILKFNDIHGANNLIKLSKAWLRSFYLHNREFVLMETGNGQKEFFQVIGGGFLKVLFQWQKKMSLSKEVGKSNYHFSDPVKIMYLYREEAFYKFKNNKSFIGCFAPSQQASVKKYLTENRINVKKASDEEMLNLITFCSHIED
jgi:hypothetical protein